MVSLLGLVLKEFYKFFAIPYEEINTSIAFWIGIALIIVAIVLYILDIKKVIAVIGLDTIKSTKKIKNSNIINIIDKIIIDKDRNIETIYKFSILNN